MRTSKLLKVHIVSRALCRASKRKKVTDERTVTKEYQKLK